MPPGGGKATHLVEYLPYEKLKELFGDPSFIQALLVQAPTDEGDPQGLLQLPRALHKLVQGILQHMAPAYPHIQILHHCWVHPLKQRLHSELQLHRLRKLHHGNVLQHNSLSLPNPLFGPNCMHA